MLGRPARIFTVLVKGILGTSLNTQGVAWGHYPRLILCFVIGSRRSSLRLVIINPGSQLLRLTDKDNLTP